jgi:hypothetical protein
MLAKPQRTIRVPISCSSFADGSMEERMPRKAEILVTETAVEMAGVKSARRAIDLLEIFAANDGWLSLSDLHARTGFPQSGLHGLRKPCSVGLDRSGHQYRPLPPRRPCPGLRYRVSRPGPCGPVAHRGVELVREKTGFTAHYAPRWRGGRLP